MKEPASLSTAQLRSPPCNAESWRMIRLDRRGRALGGLHTTRPQQLEINKECETGNWRDLDSRVTRYRLQLETKKNKTICIKQITTMWMRDSSQQLTFCGAQKRRARTLSGCGRHRVRCKMKPINPSKCNCTSSIHKTDARCCTCSAVSITTTPS